MTMMARLGGWGDRLGAVRAAFLASLLLSLVATQGHLVNRDGIFYLDTARAILSDGLGAGLKTGEWAFLSMLVAGVSALTGLGVEAAAQSLDALFMAGACALLVAWVRQRQPEAAWAACLAVLAMPAYNQYRHEILREFGFWFFSLLGLWLAMRWDGTRRRREAWLSQLALAVAVLFRLEAAVFYPALMLWQAFAAPSGTKARRALEIGALPVAGGALALLLFGTGILAPPARLGYYLEAANPLHTLQLINEAAGRMSDSVFKYKYTREEAGYVLLFGLLSIIPMKALQMSGVLLVPLAYQLAVQPLRPWLARWQPLPWAFLAYFGVLAAFVTHQFFLVGRYVSLLNLLAVPAAAGGLVLLMRRFPRWKWLMVALAVLTMAANVVSSAPRKTHIVEAGRWLGANVGERSQVCLANARIAYYADWPARGLVRQEGAGIDGMIGDPRCLWIVLEAGKKENTGERLRQGGLIEVRRFRNAAGDEVIVARREAAPPAPADRR